MILHPPAPRRVRRPVVSFIAAAAVLLLVQAACSGDGGTEPETPTVASIILDREDVVMTSLGEETTLAAEARDDDGEAMQGAALTWTSGNSAVVAIAGPGRLRAVANGTAVVTVRSAADADVSATVDVTVSQQPSAATTTIVPAAETLPANGAAATTITVRLKDARGNDVPSGEGAVVALATTAGTLSDLADAGDGSFTATLTAPVAEASAIVSGALDGAAIADSAMVSFAGVPLTLVDDDYSADAAKVVTGNVRLVSAAAPFSVVDNDDIDATAAVAFVGWIAGDVGTPAKSERGGDVTMVASGDGIGRFTYDPPAGFEGTDRFRYVLVTGARADTATVTLTVAGMIWFVDSEAAACTTRASGCGRLTSPYGSLAAFQAENDGAGDNPGPNDAVFLYQRSTPYAGPLTLRDGQRLVGQDATASLAAITGLQPSAGSSFPAMEPGDAGTTTITGASGYIVRLGKDNTVRGLRVAPTGGIGIYGYQYGTFTHGDLEVEAVNAAAVNLGVGTLDGSFRKLSSSNSPNHGVAIHNSTGTFMVTGSGTPGSGGVITDPYSNGVQIYSTGAASLAWMVISASRSTGTNYGINADSVAGLTVRHSTVTGTHTSGVRHGINLNNVYGTVMLDMVSLVGWSGVKVNVLNQVGTLDLQVRGSSLSGTDATYCCSGGIRIEARGSSVVNATVLETTITGTTDSRIMFAGAQTATAHLDVSGSTFSRGAAGSDESISIMASNIFSGRLTFDIHDNDFTGSSVWVTSSSALAGARFEGRIRDNRFGVSGIPGSCVESGAGIAVQGGGAGTTLVTAITGNVMRGCASVGVLFDLMDGAGSVAEATISGNDVRESGIRSFSVYHYPSATTTSRTMCLDASGNTFGDATSYSLSAGNGTLRLPGYAGATAGGTTATTNVQSYLAARNTISGAATGTIATTTTLQGQAAGVTACTQPSF